MARLVYAVVMSLDGYTADKNGNFDWAEPDEEIWQTLPTHDQPSCIADFASLWRVADKVVYSKTLKTASIPRTSATFRAPGGSANESLSGTRPGRRRPYPRRPLNHV
jgi:hypothetical protein